MQDAGEWKQEPLINSSLFSSVMDKAHKLKLEEALAESKAKGNLKLAEAVVAALEDGQKRLDSPKAA